MRHSQVLHTLLKVNQFQSFIAKPIYCTFAKQTHIMKTTVTHLGGSTCYNT